MGCTENKAVRAPEVIRNIPEEAFSAESRLVLGKYRMIVGRPGILGEGASSVCHYGTNTRTGESVAIKVYKRSEAKSKQAGQDEEKDTEENEIKFQRQIKVLKELQKAFNPDHFAGDGKARILNSNPRSLFVRLIDFSLSNPLEKYIVTEAGQCTLKSVLQSHSTAKITLKKDQIRHVAQDIVLALGGLHQKGLIHVDVKPDNVMMFGDRWKLIDVDGCMPVGERVSCQDKTLSFSPSYCAPEWAKFVLCKDPQMTMRVDASLDAWSAGMILTELVSLHALLKPVFNKVAQGMGPQARRSELIKEFMEQVGRMDALPLPRCLDKLDEGFARMIRNGLLLIAPSSRPTMAECLEQEFMKPFDRRSLKFQWMPMGNFQNSPSGSPDASPSASETLGNTTSPEDSAVIQGVSFKNDPIGTSGGAMLEWRKALKLRGHSLQPISRNSSQQKVYPSLTRQAKVPDVIESL